MSSHFIIQLHNLRFYAPHGVFEQEALTGNEFEVNISLEIAAPEARLTSLDQTINYADVFRITRSVFDIRQQLLETLAMDIAGQLKSAFPLLQKVTIQISKQTPPIVEFSGAVSVTYHKDFTASHP